ncbi:MAG: S1C family serine protease [Candidatus Hodarchaeota archaeon]
MDQVSTIRQAGSPIEKIKEISRSVVNINTLGFPQDAFQRATPVEGIGSGFFFDREGHILTNSHIIENAKRLAVTLADRRVLQGKIVGLCKMSDIAVVKVYTADVEPIEFGDSDRLEVGQEVFAIGNPYGLTGGSIVTTGIISALERTFHTKEGGFRLVQTDALIDSGSSGGPLVDLSGRVIAINTTLIPSASGIGFAIPVNLAKIHLGDIVLYGKVKEPWLGVTGITITKGMAKHYDFPIRSGVFVVNIAPNSPADKAKIRQGNIIAEFDNRVVSNIEDLKNILLEKEPGERVELVILRGPKKNRLRVTLEQTP